MIAHRLIYAGKRGFADDRSTLQRPVGRIAADGRHLKYRNRLASFPTIRRFRARNRDLTFRKFESKDL